MAYRKSGNYAESIGAQPRGMVSYNRPELELGDPL